MTARFAGSRSLDERRRRRLSQESVEETPAPKLSRKTATKTPDESPPAISESEDALPVPDESVIPEKPWQIVLAAGIGLFFWGAVIYLGLASWPSHYGLQAAFDLRVGRLATFFSMACLFLAAQFSWMILWYRSRCRKDFMGRYRLWSWIGSFYLLLSFLNATGIHHPLTTILVSNWPIGCWRPEILYWLAPLAAGVLATHQLLIREVRHSRSSLWLAHGCLAIGGAAGVLHLAGDIWLTSPVREILTQALTSFWHYSLMVLTLVHARFVVHVNNEAPPRSVPRASRFWRMLRLWGLTYQKRQIARKQIRAQKIAEAEAKAEKAKATPMVTEPVAIPQAAPARKRKPVRASKPTAKASPPKPSPVEQKPQPEPAEEKPPKAKVRRDPPTNAPPPPKTEVAVVTKTSQEIDDHDDGAEDDPDFGQLSKKERRRLKKQQRQRNRANG